MNQKIAVYATDEVAFDAPAVAEALTRTCNEHRVRYRVTGVCQVAEAVYFILVLGRPSDQPYTYVFVSIEDATEDGVTDLLYGRWQSGFDAIGTVDLGDGAVFVLFATGAT